MVVCQWGSRTAWAYVCGSVWEDIDAANTWKGKENCVYERKLLKGNCLPGRTSTVVAWIGLGELRETSWQWKSYKYLGACVILLDLRIGMWGGDEDVEMGECEWSQNEGPDGEWCDGILVSHVSGKLAVVGDRSTDLEGEQEMWVIGSNEVWIVLRGSKVEELQVCGKEKHTHGRWRFWIEKCHWFLSLITCNLSPQKDNQGKYIFLL